MGFLLGLLSFWMSLTVTPNKITSILKRHCTNQRNNTEFISRDTLRVACVQWKMHRPASLYSYLQELLRLSQEAVDSGAQILVFPQYIGLLPCTLVPFFDRILAWALESGSPRSLPEAKLRPGCLEMLSEAFQNFLYEMYFFTFSNLARLMRVYVAAGSCLIYEQGRRTNRCLVFGPDGEVVGFQDKLTCIGLDQVLGVSPGRKLELLNLPFGKTCILLGEDSYYFEYAKWAKAQAVQLLCCPDLGNSVLRDLLELLSQQYDLYCAYSCFIQPREDATKTVVLGAFPQEEPAHAESAVVTARLRFPKPETQSSWNISPNHLFLQQDYAVALRGPAVSILPPAVSQSAASNTERQ